MSSTNQSVVRFPVPLVCMSEVSLGKMLHSTLSGLDK